MVYKEKLLKLIASLNKNEKGYIKKFGHFNSSNGIILLKLFDKYDALIKKNNSEEIVKQKIKSLNNLKDKSEKAIINLKNQLYYKLLSALQLYDQSKNAHLQMLQHFEFGLTLYARKFLDEALIEFNKALKIAKASNFEEFLPVIFMNMITITQKLSSFKDEKIDKYYMVLSNIYWLLGENALMMDNLKKNVDLFDGKNFKSSQLQVDIIPVLYNYTQQLILNNEKDTFKRYFKKFDSFQTKRSQSIIEKDLFKTIVELFANFSFAEHEKNSNIESRVWKFIDHHILNQFSHKLHMIVYFMSHSLLILKEYDRSLTWINFLLDKKLDLRQDTKVYINLATLIIHYEKQNLQLLPYQIKASEYSFKNKIDVTNSEKEILSLFRKLVNLVDKEKIKEAFIKSKKNILKLMAEDEKEKAVNWSFNIIAWLESKIENRSYGAVLKEKNKKA